MPKRTKNNRARNTLYGLVVLATAFIAGIILYKIGSYIAVITFIAVIIGLIVALAYLQHKRPEQKWIFRLIAIGLMVWVGYSWVWPAIYSAWDHKNPQTARGLARKGAETDYRIGDAVDAVALEGRIAAIDYCREKEIIQSAEIKAELKNLNMRRRTKKFTEEDSKKEPILFSLLSDIADERRICQEAIKKMDKKAGLPPLPSDSRDKVGPLQGLWQSAKKFSGKISNVDFAKINWPIKFLIIIGGIILIAIAMKFFKVVFGGTLTTIIAIALIIVFLFMALPGLGKMAEGITDTSKECAKPQVIHARAEQRCRVILSPNASTLIYPPRQIRFDFEGSVAVLDRTWVVSKVDPNLKMTALDAAKGERIHIDERWLDGFWVVGSWEDTGKVITFIPRTRPIQG